MPSTTYTVSIAAASRYGSLARDAWYACAVPEELPRIPEGTPISRSALSIAVTALPSDTFGARLNEIVTDGSWLWCAMARGAVDAVQREKAASGTALPVL